MLQGPRTDKIIQQQKPSEAVARHFQTFCSRDIEAARSGRIPQLLKDLGEGRCTPALVQSVLFERYSVAHFFSDLLGLAIDQCERAIPVPHALLHALNENLSEELGKGGYDEQPHSLGRERLLRALGVDYGQWQASLGTLARPGTGLSPAAQQVLSALIALISRGPLWAGAAMLSYEHRISRGGFGDYAALLRGIETAYPELKSENSRYGPQDALWHLHSHSIHDERHADELISGLAKSTSILGDWTDAANQGLKIWDRFWDDLR